MYLLSAICIQVLATRAFTASWWRVTRCLHVTFQYTVDATDFLGYVVSFGQYANELTGQFSATPHKMRTITRRPPCIRNNYRYSSITNFCKTCACGPNLISLITRSYCRHDSSSGTLFRIRIHLLLIISCVSLGTRLPIPYKCPRCKSSLSQEYLFYTFVTPAKILIA